MWRDEIRPQSRRSAVSGFSRIARNVNKYWPPALFELYGLQIRYSSLREEAATPVNRSARAVSVLTIKFSVFSSKGSISLLSLLSVLDAQRKVDGRRSLQRPSRTQDWAARAHIRCCNISDVLQLLPHRCASLPISNPKAAIEDNRVNDHNGSKAPAHVAPRLIPNAAFSALRQR